MKKFEILRYLKRFSLLIFLVSLAGAAAIYLYADGRQIALCPMPLTTSPRS